MKKICRICKQEKDTREFYPRPRMKDGYNSMCKRCCINDNLKRIAKNPDEYRRKARNYYYENKNTYIPRMVQYNRKWRKENPEKDKAISLSNDHLKYKRPRVCSICGKETKVQGHHPDYSKPLEIIWCCPVCHRAIHRQLKKAA